MKTLDRWWLSYSLVALLLLLLSVRSDAASVWGCPDTSGTIGGPSCGGEGSSCVGASVMDSSSAALVSVWSGTSAVVGDPPPACGAPDGQNVWRLPPSGFEAGDLIPNLDTSQLVEPSTLGFSGGGGGGDDEEDDDEFQLSDLDTSKLSAAFVAGFLIVGISWAIAFGVRTVVSMLK